MSRPERPGFFAHATVCQGVFMTSALTSVVAVAGRAGSPIDWGMRVGHLSLSRLLTSNLIFTSAGEFVFGYGLLLSFRLLERRRGSTKFAAFSLSAVCIGTLLQVFAAHLLPLVEGGGAAGLSSGPYAFLFAMLPLYVIEVPSTSGFTFFGLQMTDKAFTYAVALQLALWGGLCTALPAACGTLAGLLVHSYDIGSSPLVARAVQALKTVLGAVSWLFTRQPPRPEEGQRQGQGAGAGGGAAAAEGPRRGNRLGEQQPPPAAAPRGGRHGGGGGAGSAAGVSREAVETLAQMGFAPMQIEHALAAAGGDVNVAAEILLSGS